MSPLFQEQVLESLAKILSNPKVKNAFAKMKKKAEDDPDAKQALNTLKKATDKVKNDIDKFCKKYPDNKFCTDRKTDLG